MAYQVVAPLVITKNTDGSDLYLYYGSILPDFVSDEEVKRLAEGKFIDGESAKASAKKSTASAPSN